MPGKAAVIGGGLAAILAALLPTIQAAPEPKEPPVAKQSPAGAIEVVREEFKAVLAADSAVEPVASGFQFTEGPAWMAEGSFLLFSDIPASIIYRWSRQDGLKAWRRESRSANGNTVDLEGRLVTCEHGSRTVTRTGKDGRIETMAATYKGQRLNSPNDVVVKRDGTIWFTDPPYGIRPERAEQTANHVFRLDRGAAEPVSVVSDFSRPNGLCFSPDEALLYVADSDEKIHHVRRFRVKSDHTLEGGEVFATISPGVPDGMRVDRDGRLYSTAGDGVHVFSPAGKLLGKIRTPETAANCTFGGPDGRTLFITARTNLYAVRLAAAGAP